LTVKSEHQEKSLNSEGFVIQHKTVQGANAELLMSFVNRTLILITLSRIDPYDYCDFASTSVNILTTWNAPNRM